MKKRYLCRKDSDTGHDKRCQHVRLWIRTGQVVVRGAALGIVDEALCWRARVRDVCNGCKRAREISSGAGP